MASRKGTLLERNVEQLLKLASFKVNILAPHKHIMGETLSVEVSGLLLDGAATQSLVHPALNHTVSSFCQDPSSVASARPFPTELLASRPFCPVYRNSFMA